MEYHVVEAERISELVEDVARKITEGWKPQGGMVVEMQDVKGDYFYFQAMVRHQ